MALLVCRQAEAQRDVEVAGQYCVNDLQTKLEKKTQAVGSICC